jgi:CRP/FNR family transcriptional regulator, cyclic AMP receptor protein
LDELPRFASLSDTEMREIWDTGRRVNVPERWSLLVESTPPDQVYLVIEGQLSVLHHGEEIAQLGPGDIVGEIGVAGHRLRTGTVTALTPLVMLHMTGEEFEGLCERIPAFRSAVNETVAARLDQVRSADS